MATILSILSFEASTISFLSTFHQHPWLAASGHLVSTAFPAPMLHEIPQDMAMLCDLRISVGEAISDIDRLECTFRETADEEEGVAVSGAELYSISESIRQLRSRIEDIAQMTYNMAQRLAESIPSSQSVNTATIKAEPESTHRDALSLDDHSAPHASTSTSILPTLIVSVPSDAPATNEDDEGVYYTPLVPIVINFPPPLLPAPDLSAVYEAVIERRLKRKPSSDLQDTEVPTRHQPPKRRKREIRQSVYRRPTPLCRRDVRPLSNGLVTTIGTLVHFW